MGLSEKWGTLSYGNFKRKTYAKPSGFGAANFEATSNVPRHGGPHRNVPRGLELKQGANKPMKTCERVLNHAIRG